MIQKLAFLLEFDYEYFKELNQLSYVRKYLSYKPEKKSLLNNNFITGTVNFFKADEEQDEPEEEFQIIKQ